MRSQLSAWLIGATLLGVATTGSAQPVVRDHRGGGVTVQGGVQVNVGPREAPPAVRDEPERLRGRAGFVWQSGRWDWRGDPADCEKVHALLFAPRGKHPAAGLRRRPEDIVGWPELNRILTPIELDTESRELYAQAWVAFRKEMELEPHGKNPKGALAATLRLRQKSSLLRIKGTLELVRELLDNGHQVAVSVAFHETLSLARATLEAEKIPCAEIHGKLDGKTKEAERLRFQRGEAKVVFFTVEEGISLHQGEHGDAPRSEIIHDLRWSAIQMAQIEGRCHRDGKFAQVYWAYADGTLEEKIARVVAGRIQSMKEMVGDDTETLREIENLLRG